MSLVGPLRRSITRDADDGVGSQLLSGLPDSVIVFAEVDTIGTDPDGQGDIIVYDKRYLCGVTNIKQAPAKRQPLREAVGGLVAVLHDAGTAFYRSSSTGHDLILGALVCTGDDIKSRIRECERHGFSVWRKTDWAGIDPVPA